MVSIYKIVVAVGVSELTGVLGALFTYPSLSTWYASLQKPSFVPPNWIFFPVWVTLYTLMGIAAYLVWDKGLRARAVRTSLSLFALQLVLNFLWTFIFFGLHSLLYGLVEIVMLWIVIALTMISFSRVSKAAGLLLLPYIVWISIAGTLNYYLWLLNP